MLARHLTVDLYNCKAERLQEMETVRENLRTVLLEAGYQPLEITAASITEEHFTVVSIFGQGHIALHVYTKLRYVAIDQSQCSRHFGSFSSQTRSRRRCSSAGILERKGKSSRRPRPAWRPCAGFIIREPRSSVSWHDGKIHRNKESCRKTAFLLAV